MPDAEIFDEVIYDYDILKHRLRELAFLNQQITITLTDERDGHNEISYFEGGIRSFCGTFKSK